MSCTEKNGWVLTCDKGQMAYLHADSASDAFAGSKPLPDPTHWLLALLGGVTVRVKGRLGARGVVQPRPGKVTVDCPARPGTDGASVATALILEGLKAPPVVILNGRALPGLKLQTVAGRPCFLMPLR